MTEETKQIINAIDRAVRSNQAAADKLFELGDYSAEFPSEDARLLEEARHIISNCTQSSTEEELEAKHKESKARLIEEMRVKYERKIDNTYLECAQAKDAEYEKHKAEMVALVDDNISELDKIHERYSRVQLYMRLSKYFYNLKLRIQGKGDE